MTTREENDLLTRVGPGTLMGGLMREYWIPAGLSSEFPHADSDPVRIRLLCENLIGYRTTSGKMGLIQDACPHRGASLFYGRNEEEGIRCVYHGWKFDTEGHCLDMPSEPEATQALGAVRFVHYPCVERGGIVWTYMGPRKVPPPLPDLEANLAGGNIRVEGSVCNWLQSMENNMDTTHAGFLHWGSVAADAPDAPWMDAYTGQQMRNMIANRAVDFIIKDTDSGATSLAYREQHDDPDSYYYRIMNWHFPFFTQSPTNQLTQPANVVAVVPVDDTYTISYNMAARPLPANRVPLTRAPGASSLPNTTDWLGRFRPVVTVDDDLQIDRRAQREDKDTEWGYTGINVGYPGFGAQDRGITEAQGAIQDRTIENLRSTDRMIHAVRMRLLQAAKALRDEGTAPPGVDSPEVYRQRAGSVTLPKGVDAWEATRGDREAFLRTMLPTQRSFVGERLDRASSS
jgi:phthalate 4,5-dioxygenase